MFNQNPKIQFIWKYNVHEMTNKCLLSYVDFNQRYRIRHYYFNITKYSKYY